MDRVESLLAAKRLSRWPGEWQQMILELPVKESLLIAELAALLDAQPSDEESRQ